MTRAEKRQTSRKIDTLTAAVLTCGQEKPGRTCMTAYLEDGNPWEGKVRILACLDALGVGRLSKQVGVSGCVVVVRSECDFTGASARQIDAVVVDPAVATCFGTGQTRAALTTKLVMQVSPAPVIIYAEPSLAAMTLLSDLSRSRHHVEFVARGWRDEADQLRSALSRILNDFQAADASKILCARTAPLLRHIPDSLARAMVFVFERPELVGSVSELSEMACRSERTVERWLKRAGLACASDFLSAAKTARAHRLLSQPRSCVWRVAHALNYASQSSFRDTIQRMARCTPSALRSRAPDEIAHCLATKLGHRRRPHRASGDCCLTN